MNSPALLSISGIAIEYAPGSHHAVSGRGDVVRDVSFDVGPGEVVALVGQSGSGKSTIARAVQGLLPANGRITAGDILVEGRVVTQLSQRRWRELRGSTIGFVPQDPLGSLDPLKPVGDQIAEVLRVHRIAGRDGARRRAVELLEHVGIADASRRAGDYPH